MRTEKNK